MKKLFIPLLMTTKLYAACAEVEGYFDTSILKPVMYHTTEHKDEPIDPIFRSDLFFHFFEGSVRTESGESTVYALHKEKLESDLLFRKGNLGKLKFQLKAYGMAHDLYFSLKK